MENYNCKFRVKDEYLNGEIHGKGKEYDYNGILIFEDEYFNGERYEKGKECDIYN